MKKYGVDVMDNDCKIDIKDNKFIVYCSKAGEGKTSFILQQALTNIKENDNMNVLYISGESTIDAIMPRIINWYKERSVDRFEFEDIKNSEGFTDLMSNFYFMFMDSINADDIINFVTENNIEMIFIDSPVLNSVNNTTFYTLKCFEFLKDVVIILSTNIASYRNTIDLYSPISIPVTNLADLVISIEKFELDKNDIFNSPVTVASVVKNRNHNKSKYIFFSDYKILKFSSTF